MLGLKMPTMSCERVMLGNSAVVASKFAVMYLRAVGWTKRVVASGAGRVWGKCEAVRVTVSHIRMVGCMQYSTMPGGTGAGRFRCKAPLAHHRVQVLLSNRSPSTDMHCTSNC